MPVQRGRRFWITAGAVSVVAAGAGYGLQAWLGRDAESSGTSAAAVEALLKNPMPDLKGEARTLDSWRGKVLVINFWATWCAPCRKEIPEFIRAQRLRGPRGLQIVGVAFDQPEPAAEFARELNMNYPILIGGLDTMALMRESGNRAGVLPFTLILDRQSRVVKSHLGVLSEHQIDALITPLI